MIVSDSGKAVPLVENVAECAPVCALSERDGPDEAGKCQHGVDGHEGYVHVVDRDVMNKPGMDVGDEPVIVVVVAVAAGLAWDGPDLTAGRDPVADVIEPVKCEVDGLVMIVVELVMNVVVVLVLGEVLVTVLGEVAGSGLDEVAGSAVDMMVMWE